METGNQLLTVSDAAADLGVSAEAVRYISNRGDLQTMRTRGGVRLFYERDVKRLAKKRAKERAAGINKGGRPRKNP